MRVAADAEKNGRHVGFFLFFWGFFADLVSWMHINDVKNIIIATYE